MRLFSGSRALPITSYGYRPPSGATARGWTCPADGCGVGGDGAPRRWPHPCPECGTPTDACLDEPWAHDARGLFLRHALARAEPATAGVRVKDLHAWLFRDALRSGDLTAAREAQADAHRYLENRQAQRGIDGTLLAPVIQDGLEHDLLDLAADGLRFWAGRAVTAGVEDDNARRTDCRQLLSCQLAFLEHPRAAGHPATPAVVAAAARLHGEIREVLTTDLVRRSRGLSHQGFAAAGPVPAIPDDTVGQMIVFGRYAFSPADDDHDPVEIWSRIAGPRYEQAVADPDGFCRDLAAEVLPAGGWAVHGAQRLVVELLGGHYGGADFLAMQDVALSWLHAQGASPAHLTGWEHERWRATRGAW